MRRAEVSPVRRLHRKANENKVSCLLNPGRGVEGDSLLLHQVDLENVDSLVPRLKFDSSCSSVDVLDRSDETFVDSLDDNDVAADERILGTSERTSGSGTGSDLGGLVEGWVHLLSVDGTRSSC